MLFKNQVAIFLLFMVSKCKVMWVAFLSLLVDTYIENFLNNCNKEIIIQIFFECFAMEVGIENECKICKRSNEEESYEKKKGFQFQGSYSWTPIFHFLLD